MSYAFERGARLARRAAPAGVAVAAAVLSLGVYAGAARVIGHRAAHHSLTITLSPRAATLAPGSSTRLTVAIRRHAPGTVKLQITSKLPRGLTARFAPAKTRRKRSVLTLRATARLRLGRYVLSLRGVAGRTKRTVRLVLTVQKPGASPAGTPGSAPGTSDTASGAGSSQASGGGSGTNLVGAAFSITGNAPQSLEPGIAQPLDLQIHNPNSTALTLSTLTAAVGVVNASRATQALSCTAGDFTVQQYSGLLPLVVAPNATVSLQQLGVPEAQWPEVWMLDRASNQDGCQGASLSLTYGAAASAG